MDNTVWGTGGMNNVWSIRDSGMPSTSQDIFGSPMQGNVWGAKQDQDNDVITDDVDIPDTEAPDHFESASDLGDDGFFMEID